MVLSPQSRLVPILQHILYLFIYLFQQTLLALRVKDVCKYFNKDNVGFLILIVGSLRRHHLCI